MSSTKLEGDLLVEKMWPVRDLVLVRCLRENRKVGSIIIPDNLKQGLDIMVSQVVARGPEVKARPWELRPGDFVLHVRVCGVEYDGVLGVLNLNSQVKGATHKFLRESEILAIVDPGVIVSGEAQYNEGRTGTWMSGDS